jgi:hypothetical protein
MIPNIEILGSLVRDMNQGLSQLFYVLLPVVMILSVVIGYFKSGEPTYPDVLKRALVASLLLASFPEVSGFILDVCDGIAAKIDNMSGLETFIRMAEEKSKSYAGASNVLMLKFDDLLVAILSFGSFILLYIARYITIALYYFYWVLLSICSPLMILCYVFPKTAQVTANLYRGLIEVACWKIMWAIMSAMLAALSFGNVYKTEGSYITLIVMNFVIAIALLFTPIVMRSLITEGVQSTGQNIGSSAVSAAIALPARLQTVAQVSRESIQASRAYAVQKMNKVQKQFSRSKGS